MKMISFKILAVLFHTHVIIGLEFSPIPFQFPCYENDICTWPEQYCSSEPFELRCIPCFTSVCKLESPPLQCQYNCSMNGQYKVGDSSGGEDIVKSDKETNNDSNDRSHIAIVTLSSLCVVLLLVVMYLVVHTGRQNNRRKEDEEKTEATKQLMATEEQKSVIHVNERRGPQPLKSNGSSDETKLKNVPPTKESSSQSKYKPTTYMASN